VFENAIGLQVGLSTPKYRKECNQAVMHISRNSLYILGDINDVPVIASTYVFT